MPPSTSVNNPSLIIDPVKKNKIHPCDVLKKQDPKAFSQFLTNSSRPHHPFASPWCAKIDGMSTSSSPQQHQHASNHEDLKQETVTVYPHEVNNSERDSRGCRLGKSLSAETCSTADSSFTKCDYVETEESNCPIDSLLLFGRDEETAMSMSQHKDDSDSMDKYQNGNGVSSKPLRRMQQSYGSPIRPTTLHQSFDSISPQRPRSFAHQSTESFTQACRPLPTTRRQPKGAMKPLGRYVGLVFAVFAVAFIAESLFLFSVLHAESEYGEERNLLQKARQEDWFRETTNLQQTGVVEDSSPSLSVSSPRRIHLKDIKSDPTAQDNQQSIAAQLERSAQAKHTERSGDFQLHDSLAISRSHQLEPLDALSREQYTIRLNTFQRPDQLLVSLNHHSRCPGVAQIQVVWCESETEPAEEIARHPSGKVVIERHDTNSLNERFHLLSDPPTLGIFSLDDDLLWPCEALDSGFFKWTRSPHRIVGYDARVHVEDKKTGRWKYGYKSVTQSKNKYSMTLLRSAFLHRDYLDLYTMHLPRPIFETVASEFNCEDIAMSLFVTAMTEGKPPLLADYWATNLMTKLYAHETISGSHDHKAKRDVCVDTFASQLGLRDGGQKRLKSSDIFSVGHQSLFAQGARADDSLQKSGKLGENWTTDRERELISQTSKWKKKKHFMESAKEMLVAARLEAMQRGLIADTTPWEERWGKHKKTKAGKARAN